MALVGFVACAHGVDPIGPPGAGGSSGTPAATVGSGGTTTSPSSVGPGPGGSPSSSTGQGGAAGMGEGGAVVSSSTASTSGGGGNGTLRVQYKTGDTNATDQQVRPHLRLFNDGSTAVNLADVTIRYWFTKEPGGTLVFACDYAALGCGTIVASFVMASGVNADHYLEISFNSGTLAPGQDTGEIQARFHMSDYANWSETNDYSYDGTKTSFADWGNATAYDATTLVWGSEP